MRLENSRIKELSIKEIINLFFKQGKEKNFEKFNEVYFISFCYLEDVGERIVTLVDIFDNESKIFAYFEDSEVADFLREKKDYLRKLPFRIILTIEKMNDELIPKIVWIKPIPELETLKKYIHNYLVLSRKILKE